jgi:hypothetical protein
VSAQISPYIGTTPKIFQAATGNSMGRRRRLQYRRARSGQVETPRLKELAQDQWLEHDLGAKVVSTFVDHALGACLENGLDGGDRI